MLKNIQINSLSELKSAARNFINITANNRKFAFFGEMGSGKTTFIKAICKELGANGLVTSPTFSLINEYALKNGEFACHFDLYRIKNIEELYDIGYEEYFYGENYLFIEWAEKAADLLPNPIVRVEIKETIDNKRLVTIYL